MNDNGMPILLILAGLIFIPPIICYSILSLLGETADGFFNSDGFFDNEAFLIILPFFSFATMIILMVNLIWTLITHRGRVHVFKRLRKHSSRLECVICEKLRY